MQRASHTIVNVKILANWNFFYIISALFFIRRYD